MNLFEKIQNVRKELQEAKIKMTGKNTYAGYDYFELSDFLKPLNELMQKYNMTAIPSFTSELATLTAINCEDPNERFVITSPFSSASLKGCHEVQNIGAVETYQRRYLYQALFDIAESDGLNATQGKEDNKGKNENKATQTPTNKSKYNQEPKKEPTTDKSNLPFPEQGVSKKEPSKDEIKAKRTLEIQEAHALYYPNDETFLKRLTDKLNLMYGCKASDLSEDDYIAVMKAVKNREI
jgi:hypothetical protein